MTSILIDKRIGSKDLFTLIPRGYCELTDLDFGDAVVVGNGPDGLVTEAFERKRLGEILSYVRGEERFAGHQLRGLRDYDHVWLVVEDEVREHPETGILQRVVARHPMWRMRGGKRVKVGEELEWADASYGSSSKVTWRAYVHWLLSMVHKGGVDGWFNTRDARETAKLIYTIYTWRQKKWTAHRSTEVFAPKSKPCKPLLYRPTGVVKLLVDVARSFDGVGYETALAIARSFNSPDEFWRASAQRLASVVVTTRQDGADVKLGRKLAESIAGQRMQRR